MIVLLFLAPVLMFAIIYARKKSISESMIDAFLLFSFFTVVFGESISLFYAYNYVSLSLCWGGVVISLSYFVYKNKSCMSSSIRILWKRLTGYATENKIRASFFLLLCLITILRAALYPPQNVDSYIYHLSRAFYYYKNEAIANFPSSYAWSNYSGPLNAVFMAQLLVFLHGKDYLHNFIQFIPWIVSAVAVYKISRLLGCTERWAEVGFWIAITLPEAVLEAATTQCDSLMASYCVIAVYYMLKFSVGRGNRAICDMFFLGVAGGGAMLSKVSSGIILIWFLILFVFWYVLYKNRLFPMFVAAISSLSMIGGYWLRNFKDLNGDFLALRVSSAMSHTSSGAVTTFVGRIVYNIGYLFGGHNTLICRYLDTLINKIGKIFRVTEVDPATFTCHVYYVSHDEYPYFIHISLVLCCAVILLLLSVKSRNRITFLYTVCSLLALLGIAVSIEAGIPSIARYELGPVFLLAGTVGCVFQYFENKKIIKVLCDFLAVSISAAVILCSFGDARQSPFQAIGRNREQLRNNPYSGMGYEFATEKYMKIIEENDFDKIGFYEERMAGYYPILYQLGDKKYITKSVYGTMAANHLDYDFIPDCIVYVGEKDCKELTVNKTEYTAATESSPLLFNEAYTSLFVRK